MAVSVERTETVGALKQQLASLRQADGWEASAMELIKAGRFLEDDDVLALCLSDGDFIVASGTVPRSLPPMADPDGNESVPPSRPQSELMERE